MRRVFIIFLALLLAVPCRAVTLVEADYDGDEWVAEEATPPGMVPLRAAAAFLPYEVEWQERTIIITTEERTWKFSPDRWLPEGMTLTDGVTWVTPQYLCGILQSGRAFCVDGELYYLTGESKGSALIRGGERFRLNVLAAMYRLKVALPEDYALIRKSLSGGVEESGGLDGETWQPSAYIYPRAKRPTAFIVASGVSGAQLAELIAHEAYHVVLRANNRTNEIKCQEYAAGVKAALLERM